MSSKGLSDAPASKADAGAAGLLEIPPKVVVIVSCWRGRTSRYLWRLLDQICRIDAGMPFSLTVVCNGGDQRPLALPARYGRRGTKVLNRRNSGYNIGAWDYGWRQTLDGEYFLFLQDECQILRTGWLQAFVRAMTATPEIGLLGESINWSRSWEIQREMPLAVRCLNRDGEPPFNSVDFLRDFVVGLGIPPGETAEHLQSLVLFTSRRVLEAIDGFPSRDNYAEAVGTEIAISKKVLAHGYRLAQIGPVPFTYFKHAQWSSAWQRRWLRTKLMLRSLRARLAWPESHKHTR